jgi:hypothetical protein
MYRLYAAALAAAILAGCWEARVTDAGGNSSETIAMVGGKVVDADGNGVKGAWVALVPDAYNPVAGPALPAGLIAATDGKGAYAFTKVPKGLYGIEARHPSDGTRLFAQGMDLKGSKESLPTDTLRQPGRLRVRLPDYFKDPGGYVFLPHTRFAWPVTGTALEHGYIDLDSLPACNYGAVAFAKDTNLAAADTLGRGLDLLPGDSLALGVFAGWAHAARIVINTTASGAGVGTTLTGFPMLVRLAYADLDFSQAAADGADLRFSKPDGTPLAYQIDHWDAAKREAAVWVALDTVRGNDSAQSFRMHWGKTGAVSRSDGPAVFGTAGFAAAWHLEEEAAGTGTAGLYRNSAANANHGTDSLTAGDRTGVIGNGHYFSPGEYVRVPGATSALKPAGTVSVSAWIKPGATDSGGAEIASMGNDYGIRVTPNGQAYLFNYDTTRTDSSNFLFETTGLNLLDDQWHLVTGILDGTRMEIYVDGVPAGGKDSPQGALNYDGGPDFFIGHHGNRETRWDYTGYIDEVRVLPAHPSAAWLRLAYLTQKPGAAVLKFFP